ncbi:MAG: lipid A export permease/ATP-binding protein MsbA [Piscirickettsiaceae bacterium CG_4_10_14_3_um_filter_44_349]|nr:lipid A export permease/ATP-binding protein MsbA [Thiomicrospira sp.]OIP95375.1 MAG: lipid A export permease/ATP-binding protein MsbA [Thiomicrospira sp. CG2_30_44_34]PIQ03270.1 MAG: lipid A export permease/ATP-binding protein MsbA [Piscirickettsiaceae bacterium CG18_big_fil_WC_8_21_14_2_50_44_103]PIU37886.1 MAG: lipid A export permease/ATP-binding protein MsbA [Piscirickettsiaceae bacterium CG07_land_8_20_14_0_80_44_28]PIW77161.1 MAG: lipid A export permease/ATP-binding protein MsbA [Piscir
MFDKQTLRLYKRLLSYIKPYWKVVLLTLVTLIITASMEPLMPALLKPLVDDSLIAKDPDAILHIPLLIMLVFIIKGITEYISKVTSEWVAHKAILDIRAEMFAKMNRLPQQAHTDYTMGKLLSKITYDVLQVGNTLSQAWIVIIRDTFIILGLVGFLLYTSWQLTLLMLLIGPIVAIIISRASKLMRSSSKEMQSSMGELTSRLEEGLNGHKDIKIYNAEQYEEARFFKTAETLRKHTMAVVKVASLNVPLVQILAAIALSGVLYVASLMSAQDLFTPGEFIAFITAMAMIFDPIRRLTSINQTIQKGMAAAESIFDLLDQPNEPDQGHQNLQNPKGEIQFKSVTFYYKGTETPALKDFSLTIPAKKTTALVGQSGSGKTTLANLITRFYETDAGDILIDGHSIKSIELHSLRQNIALVSQNVILFNDTVAANIAYGHTEFDEEAIIAAAQAAHAWEFIEKMPQGLNTMIGENGALLSGGQRQRIAIARAFLKNAPILILDEATSALDNQSEYAIQQAMNALRQNRTVIIIAHRLSTIENADNIVVLEGGTLKEQGTHTSLMAFNGIYRALYQQGTPIE